MKCYDKEMIRALKDGSVIELDSNSIHNHLEQPGNEYWEHREVGFCMNAHCQKRAKIAEQFGKYAHTAPTQLQQTRNQISYLATKAIDDLMDLDKRRANARKTRKEIRAKYGWQLLFLNCLIYNQGLDTSLYREKEAFNCTPIVLDFLSISD